LFRRGELENEERWTSPPIQRARPAGRRARCGHAEEVPYAPYNPPRHLRQGDELPDDFGTRPGDTLTFGAGSYIRAFNAEEFRQFTDRPDGVVYGRGWSTTTQLDPPAGLLDERPRRRGLNRLLLTGWRRTR